MWEYSTTKFCHGCEAQSVQGSIDTRHVLTRPWPVRRLKGACPFISIETHIQAACHKAALSCKASKTGISSLDKTQAEVRFSLLISLLVSGAAARLCQGAAGSCTVHPAAAASQLLIGPSPFQLKPSKAGCSHFFVFFFFFGFKPGHVLLWPLSDRNSF